MSALWQLSAEETARRVRGGETTAAAVVDAALARTAEVEPSLSAYLEVYDEKARVSAPSTFKSTLFKGNEYKGQRYTIQVAPEDCTGCNLCVNVCPAKDRTNPKHKAINMQPQAPLRNDERVNYDFFLNLPELDRDKAQFLVIAGKKRTEVAWPAGRYAATYRVTRDGAEVLRKTFDIEARPR